jgi:hypothetical protein
MRGMMIIIGDDRWFAVARLTVASGFENAT